MRGVSVKRIVIDLCFAAVMVAAAFILVKHIERDIESCGLLETGLIEATGMAEAWYTQTGELLRYCGVKGAREMASEKACYARRFNDGSVVCE